MVGGDVRVAGSGAGISVVSSRVVAVVGGIPMADGREEYFCGFCRVEKLWVKGRSVKGVDWW